MYESIDIPELIKLLWNIFGYFSIACFILASLGGLVQFLLKGDEKKDNYVRSYRKSLVVVLTIIVIWAVILTVITVTGDFAIR